MIDFMHDLQSSFFNNTVIERLQSDAQWKLSVDQQTSGLQSGKSDAGFLFLTYFEKPLIEDPFFNTVGEIIFDSVLQNSEFQFNNIRLMRFNYNYYNQSSNGVDHIDFDDNNTYSIIYNFNDNDGGTMVNGKFYQSKQSAALMFPSNFIHKGIGPKLDKQRYALNIIFQGILKK